ncbi:MAG: response regulator [Ghiorsea sp.]
MIKVLVVDAEQEHRDSMTEILSTLGFEVVATDNTKKALDYIHHQGDIELMMLDLNLPGQSGYDFLVELRLQEKFLESPKIIMVTNEVSMGSMLSALAAGADEYIMKPFDQGIVASKLDIIGVDYNQPLDEDDSCQ